MLLASTCLLCRRPGPAVCPACAAELAPAPTLSVPLWVDRCHAPFDYSGIAPAVTALKNGDRRDLIPWLADQMASCAPVPRGAVVTWAPTSAARARQRGFDQAELLARAVARRWRVPCRRCLVRRAGPAQAGRSRDERRDNPSFAASRQVPPTVVLVDDVATTGATLTAAARALRSAGAAHVVALVAARARARSGLQPIGPPTGLR